MSLPPTVLIIEDDPVFRRVLGFTIARSGLNVETANDGDSGYERLMCGGVDFIVTDYQMPGCGGVELLERLDELQDYRRPGAILCTAKGLELDGESLRKRFRLVGILHKPFSPRKLSEMIIAELEAESRLQQCQANQPTNSAGSQTSAGLSAIDLVGGSPAALARWSGRDA